MKTKIELEAAYEAGKLEDAVGVLVGSVAEKCYQELYYDEQSAIVVVVFDRSQFQQEHGSTYFNRKKNRATIKAYTGYDALSREHRGKIYFRLSLDQTREPVMSPA